MRFELIARQLRALPEIAAWPDALDLVERAIHRELRSVWDYPPLACRAVGGGDQQAQAVAAAIFCAVTSIHLADDLLDQDPAGDYRRLGAGKVANLALAFQAAGHRLLDGVDGEPARLAALHRLLASTGLATAHGQSLEVEEPAGEAGYWRVVERKTPPLFAAALAMGGLAGGAPQETAAGLGRLGERLGKLVQVSDDAADALRTPAAADWRLPAGNLALLYALTADHPDRARFGLLAAAAPDDPAALAAAQRIVLSSGALAYCAYHLLGFWQEARALLGELTLTDPEPLERLLAEHIRPLHALLREAGVEAPESLRLE